MWWVILGVVVLVVWWLIRAAHRQEARRGQVAAIIRPDLSDLISEGVPPDAQVGLTCIVDFPQLRMWVKETHYEYPGRKSQNEYRLIPQSDSTLLVACINEFADEHGSDREHFIVDGKVVAKVDERSAFRDKEWRKRFRDDAKPHKLPGPLGSALNNRYREYLAFLKKTQPRVP